jgi:hypothetical protein
MTTNDDDQQPVSLTPVTPPPLPLTQPELRLYKAVINSVPRGHFEVSDALALCQYVQLVLQLEAVSKQAAGTPFTDADQVAAVWRARDLLQRRVMTMQTALRLTPAARKRIQPTKLGAERAAQRQGAIAIAAADQPATKRRDDLLFGRCRPQENGASE